jgi:uncharacterized SAM-binding protein YcdF (DUF218 family)
MKPLFSPLFEPLGALWLLLVLVLVGLLCRRQWRCAAWLGLPVTLIFLLGSTPIIDRLVAAAERPYVRSGLNRLPKADAVVALGGGHAVSLFDPLGFSIGEPGDRYLTAVLLTRLGKAPVLVLGGSLPTGVGADTDLEMAPVQAWIKAWSLTPVTVTSLGLCADTHDEALHFAGLADRYHWKSTLLVTSALHLRRAEAVFKKQGLNIIPVACDFQVYGVRGAETSFSVFPSQPRLRLWSLYLHEKIGWWVYRWRGWI